MDTAYVAGRAVRSSVVPETTLAKFGQRDGLVIGIVSEAEASASKRCSLINIETGKDQNIVLLMKNNAGFLVGNLVLYDQRSKSVSWVENDSYTFSVITRLKPRLIRPESLAQQIECPECTNKVAAGDMSEHLKRQHWFPRTIDLDKFPDKFPGGPPAPTRNRQANGSSRVRAVAVKRICPNPSRWDDVFKKLVKYAETYPCTPSQPPTPLILGGWVSSSDNEKMRRWSETVDWASANGCHSIVEEISDQDFYKTKNPTSDSIGPMGGQCYRPWDFEPKVRPPEEELEQHLAYLTAQWSDIAGSHLSTVTRPMAFTGKKARRLLVQAKGESSPPWGGWSDRSTEEAKRRTFTRFRSAVNEAIASHEVDHIEFVIEPA